MGAIRVGKFRWAVLWRFERVFKFGEEEDDGFDDVEAGDVIGKGVASGGVEDNVEVGFFFDFAASCF